MDRVVVAVAAMVVACAAPVAVQTATVKAFFVGSLPSGLENLKPYAGSPDERAGRPAKDHGRVVREFDWWIRRAMKSEYAPGHAFVERNILLIPAKNTNGKEDLAFLSYEIAGKTFRVVQTGGYRWNARMWIFVHDPANGEVRSAEDAAKRVEMILGTYISTTVREQVPTFSFKKASAVYVGKEKPSSPPKEVNVAKCFIGDKDSCLVIPKDFPEMRVPMQEPELDGWFSWGNDEKPPTDTELTPAERAFRDKDPTKPTAPPIIAPPSSTYGRGSGLHH